MSNTNVSYEDLQKIVKKDHEIKIKNIAIQALQDILSWKEADISEGNNAIRIFNYIEDKAHEALEKIAYLDTQELNKEKSMEINKLREFDKQLEQTIQSLKENYFNHILYINCKKELENAGFTILEPEKDYNYPKVLKEY